MTTTTAIITVCPWFCPNRYGKKIVSTVSLGTLSGPVLYTNLLSVPAMFVLASLDSEPTKGLLENPAQQRKAPNRITTTFV